MHVVVLSQGAAYGIAGVVKGLGILSLKQLDIMGKLTEAIQEKKNYKYREGTVSVFVFSSQGYLLTFSQRSIENIFFVYRIKFNFLFFL